MFRPVLFPGATVFHGAGCRSGPVPNEEEQGPADWLRLHQVQPEGAGSEDEEAEAYNRWKGLHSQDSGLETGRRGRTGREKGVRQLPGLLTDQGGAANPL